MTINRLAMLYVAATILYVIPVLSIPTSRSLVQACKTGDVGGVKSALTLGLLWVDVNYKLSLHQETPLTEAAKQGNDEIVQLLLNAGAKVDLPGWSQRTALDNAISGGHETVVKRLLEAGADPEYIGVDNLMYNDVYTPLQRAALGGHTEIVQILIAHGAESDRINRYGDGWGALYCAARNGHLDTAKALIAAGAKSNRVFSSALQAGHSYYKPGLHMQPHKDSPLGVAIRNRHKTVVKLLIDSAKSTVEESAVDLIDEQGMAPLHHAAASGFEVIALMLIRAGASLDLKDKQGMTPLHHAVKGCCAKVVRQLLTNGAKLDLTDAQNMTPFDLVEKCVMQEPSAFLAENYNNIKRILSDSRAALPNV